MLVLALICLQVMATLILAFAIRHASKIYDIPLTIHNTPIVVMWILGMMAMLWLSITFPLIYLGVGFICGMLLLATSELSDSSKISSALISLSAIFIWVQITAFVAFVILNQDKIELE